MYTEGDFPAKKYRIYTVYTYKCMVLANPTSGHFVFMGGTRYRACHTAIAQLAARVQLKYIGLARTVYIHRI